MKGLYLSACILLATIAVHSKPIDSTQAKSVAQNFMGGKYYSLTTSPDGLDMNTVYTASEDTNNLYYIFNLTNNTGFAIVSATNKAYPVLAYSIEDNYDINKEHPPAFNEHLAGIKSQLKEVIKDTVHDYSEAKTMWKEYSHDTREKSANKTEKAMDVAPLISAEWNQDGGYNDECPDDTYVGCVAVAQGQVMSRWALPDTGTGSYCYEHKDYGEQCADFGNTFYDWSNMPDNSATQDVAKLLYHIGVSVDMNYGTESSGAFTGETEGSLKDYFKYSSNMVFESKSSFTDEDWKNMLKAELDAGRPMIYKGGNHAFNVDGYQSTDHFHFNWGWGGSDNGYFYLDDLTPGGHDFTDGQSAGIGIIPEKLFPGMDTSGITELTCKTLIHDSTTNGPRVIHKYGDYYRSFSGPERIYKVHTSTPGRLKAYLMNRSSDDLRILILSDPHKDSLLAYDSYNEEMAYAENTSPGTYYIMVDGENGVTGTYDIKAVCPENKPDLTVNNPQINPYNVEESMDNVKLSCEIENIGNQSAGANTLKFYYSEDEYLNAGDTFIDSVSVESLDTGDVKQVEQLVTMPDSMTTGQQYVLYKIDAGDIINETDENDNTQSGTINVAKNGNLDCSGAVSLSDGEWYYGNTATEGDSLINEYNWMNDATGNEVVHKVTPEFDGVMKVDYTENIAGDLYLLFLPACNEFLVNHQMSIYGSDTLTSGKYMVNGGQTYYMVVDGKDDVSGAYGIRVHLPDSCPDPELSTYGDTNRCDNSGDVSLFAYHEYDNFQWYKDDHPILGEEESKLIVNEDDKADGDYFVEITQNNCAAFSDTIHVEYSPKPSGASITANGNTSFCEGSMVELEVTSDTNYTFNWLRDGNRINGADEPTYNAKKTGKYQVAVTNNSCTIESDTVTVDVSPAPVDIGDTLPPPSEGLYAFWKFNPGNYSEDHSGNGNKIYNSGSSLQVDDRFGNYKSAFLLDGVDDYFYQWNSINDPDTLTLNIWFKTSTNTGGRLIGFGDKQYSTLSNSYDRHIYMSNDGRIHFGVYDGSSHVVSSSSAYNDDKWHMATGIYSDDGLKLYIDGNLKDSDGSVSNAQSYDGSFKLGYGNLNGWPNEPDSLHFKGHLDDIRIYRNRISDVDVRLLYEARRMNITVDSTYICGSSGNADIRINNSQQDVQYELRKNSDNTVVDDIVGNGDTLNLTTGSISSTTTYNMFTTNQNTGCSRQLDSLITIHVDTAYTPSVAISSDEPDDSICTGDMIQFTASPVYGGTTPSYQWKVNGTNTGTNSPDFSTNTLSNNDSVWVQMTTDLNCVTQATVSSDKYGIHVISLNKPSISQTIDTLTASSDADAYQWFYEDNMLSDTTQQIQVSQEGDYKVIAVSNGCYSDTSDPYKYISTCKGCGEITAETSWKVWPNPTNGELNISVESSEEVTFELLNVSGKVLYRERLTAPSGTTQKLNVSDLQGFYLLKVITANEVYTKQVIIY